MKEALILAGGKGLRLSSITKGGQKVIVRISKEKTFLEYILEKLYLEKFKIVHLATGYKATDVEKLINSLKLNNFVKIIKEKKSLGTGGAILNALPYIKTKKLLVINGDTFNDINYSDLFKIHKSINSDISILTKYIENVSRYGEIETDKKNRILKFSEKNPNIKPGLINAGVYIINTNTLKICSEKHFSIEKFFSDNALKFKIYSIKSDKKFIDIGIPEDFYKFQTYFSKEL